MELTYALTFYTPANHLTGEMSVTILRLRNKYDFRIHTVIKNTNLDISFNIIWGLLRRIQRV